MLKFNTILGVLMASSMALGALVNEQMRAEALAVVDYLTMTNEEVARQCWTNSTGEASARCKAAMAAWMAEEGQAKVMGELFAATR